MYYHTQKLLILPLFLLLLLLLALPPPTLADTKPVLQEFAAPLRKAPPDKIVASPDGSIWFTQTNTNNVERLNPGTGQFKTYHTFLSTSFPQSIATDRQGNLWFSASAKHIPNTHVYPNIIGRISSQSGNVIRYRPISYQDISQFLTLGADGNIWYVTRESIGRITPAGNIAEFSQSYSENFWGITALTSGSDSNMWFTTRDGKIGKITPLGHLTLYTLPYISYRNYLPALVTGPDGNLWLMNSTNSIYRITPQGRITIFAVPPSYATSNWRSITANTDGLLWFTDKLGNQLVSMTMQGSFTSYPIPTALSQPTNLTTARDGTLWFSETGTNKIGHFSPPLNGSQTVKHKTEMTSLFQEFAVPEQSIAPLTLVSGSGGTLWFTELQTASIGSITTNGILHQQYPTHQNYQIYGQIKELIRGHDNNLWFPYEDTEIARMTPDGTLTIFPADMSRRFYSFSPNVDGNVWFLSGPFSYGYVNNQGVIHIVGIPHNASAYNAQDIQHLASGLDGTLWIVEPSANKIGHLTRHGQITEYPIPQGSSRPTLIIGGADASAWFLETNGNKISHITPDGLFKTFPVQAPLVDAMSMTFGPDGNLWLAIDNSLVRMTQNGIETDYPLPSDSYVESITTGPDGNIWFTESGSGKIGRLLLPQN